MTKFILISILHHSEPADPDLLAWIIHTLRWLFGGDPRLLIGAIFVIIVSIPIGILIANRFFARPD
ncbi:MAG: hypothetical protein QF530_06060 [SAR202 cluster bacterium]|nr:hypothetical protein [SAR202 cluster bacterium]